MRRQPFNSSFLGTFTHHPPDYLFSDAEPHTFPFRGDASEHDAVFDLRGGEPLIQTNFDLGRDRNGADVPTLAIKINNGPVVISLLKVA